MRTTGRRGEPDRSKTGASRHLPVRRESDNPRKGKPDRSEVGGGRPLNRVQKERQLKQDIGEIEATELADGSVTEAKLASGAVTSTKIGVDAITEDSISSASVSESKINDGAVTTNKLDSSNSIVVLSGVPLGDSDLGTFTGTTIADNETIKGALQDLETAVEAGGGVKYHSRYDTEAETARSGATTTTEIYYTARPDGDGYAENEVSDVGETQIIQRRLYYSDKFDADPDTSGDWTAYTTQPADDEIFANSKASLLAGLSDTDGTANTRGTLPVSLKMERTLVPNLLLDDYSGAAAAYSVRKLRAAYTGDAMRIREDSGNTETDIGFDSNGDLDTAAIASHCGANNGYVVTWYDQSGNSEDITQSTTTQQPQIYNGTAVITANGKPCLDPRSGAARLYSATTTISPTMTIMLVKSGSGGFFGAPLWYATGAATLVWDRNYTGPPGPYYGIDTAIHYATPPTDAIYTMKYGSDSATRSNGSEVATTTGNTVNNMSRVVLGGRYEAATGAWSGKAHEFVIWDSDYYSTDAADIESNANTYFGIF